jgi:RNA polymerase sigma factor (sigma-70 family)
VRGGDDRAFELLYETYHRRIAAYIYGMVGDYGRAEDIAQDVFMSALRRMRETDRPIAFKPWVYEIAKNACIDQFRRARRSQEVSIDAESGLGPADLGRLATRGAGPDVLVDQKQSLENLTGAFGGLSETHHQILVMRELEGLSYRDIGERLGMSRPSVESTLFRARRRLSEEYDELVSGERCRATQDVIGSAAGGSIGARENRRLARHISHCQPCRRFARARGLDTGVMARRPVRAKIAAFLPLPAFLRDRWLPARPAQDSGPLAAGQAASLANWSAGLSLHLDPSTAGWVKSAIAATTIALAGVGAGSVVGSHDPLGARATAGAPFGLGGAPDRSHRVALRDPGSSSSGSPAAVHDGALPAVIRGDLAMGGAGPRTEGAAGSASPKAAAPASGAGIGSLLALPSAGAPLGAAGAPAAPASPAPTPASGGVAVPGILPGVGPLPSPGAQPVLPDLRSVDPQAAGSSVVPGPGDPR